MGLNRVAITGVAACTPAGCTFTESWDAVVQASATARTSAPDDWQRDFDVYSVGLVDRHYLRERSAELPGSLVRRLDAGSLLALIVGSDAVEASGIDSGGDNRAIVVGTGGGPVAEIVSGVLMDIDGRLTRVSPYHLPRSLPSVTAGELATALNWRGPSLSVSTACAAGATALATGARLVRSGDASAALVGGVDCSAIRLVAGGFARLGALTRTRDEVRVSRPFSADRDGFMLAEGAAFLVLESLQQARSRGADVLCEIQGLGESNDAYHPVAPDPDGRGAILAITQALANAAVVPSSVGAINGHATSTELNDRTECAALEKLFDGAVPPITAPKAVTGHMFGASAAFELAISAQMIREGVVPPVANILKPISRAVCTRLEPLRSHVVLSNSFGFGGHNCAVVLGEAA